MPLKGFRPQNALGKGFVLIFHWIAQERWLKEGIDRDSLG